MEFDGHPEFLKVPANRERGFFLEWKDADGFTHVKKFVQVSEFTRTVDNKGQPFGLNGQFSEFVSVADYLKLTSMEVGWNVKTDIPQPAPAAPQPAAADPAADHCAPGLTRQERLRRLARHGQVRETGLGEFSVGFRSITFLSGSEVLTCR